MSLSLWKRPPRRWFDALWARCAPLVAVLAAAALLDACAEGESGEACFSDFECASGSCSYGACDSGVAALLGLLAEAAAASQASRLPPPAAPPPPSYTPRSASCRPRSECSISFGCVAQPPDGGVSACVACTSDPSCPQPCERLSYCL